VWRDHQVDSDALCILPVAWLSGLETGTSHGGGDFGVVSQKISIQSEVCVGCHRRHAHAL
jgi:hypothetical protein